QLLQHKVESLTRPQAPASRRRHQRSATGIRAGGGEWRLDEAGRGIGRESGHVQWHATKWSAFPRHYSLCRPRKILHHHRAERNERRKRRARESKDDRGKNSRPTLGRLYQTLWHLISVMVANVHGPQFSGGANIAI